MGFLVSDSWTLLLQGFSSTDWHAPLPHQSTYVSWPHWVTPLMYTFQIPHAINKPSYPIHSAPACFSAYPVLKWCPSNAWGFVTSYIWPPLIPLFLCLTCRSFIVAMTQQCCNTSTSCVLSQGFKQFRKFNIKRILHRRRAFFLSLFVQWKLWSCAVAKVVVRMAYLGCFWYTAAQVLHFTCMIQPCPKHLINALGYMLAYKRELQASSILGKHSTFEIYFQIWYVRIP